MSKLLLIKIYCCYFSLFFTRKTWDIRFVTHSTISLSFSFNLYILYTPSLPLPRFKAWIEYSNISEMESEGNEEKERRRKLMKIWSSGRRSDEQQVIIRTKTLFVDVILAFPPPIFLALLLYFPQKNKKRNSKYINIGNFSHFFFIKQGREKRVV